MKKISSLELKKQQLEILTVIHQFCIDNDINYWIDSGTLLGAIRHKGYIPWDDDIDVGMLRPDYDRFLSEFNKFNRKYQVYSIENNTNFPYPYAKVLDQDTVLYEPNENGLKLAINIDIFVYDSVPDNDRIIKKLYDKRDLFNKIYSYRMYNANFEPHGRFKIGKKMIKNAIKCISPFWISKLIINNSKRYTYNNHKYVANLAGHVRIKYPITLLQTFTDIEFEGYKFKAPEHWDEWLTALYGNYMELPPVEKQVSHHLFIAYKK